MTEIITDLDAKQLADRLTALELHSTSELARLEQERNEAQDKYATEATEHMLAVNKLCGERDEAREKLSAVWQSLRDSQDEVLRLTFENRELSQSIEGWENKWKCAIDMAARAELERDEALKCAKEYYVEFIRNASSDNKVSKPNPLNPFYKY
jgi:predicted  nucleic acid-binding Zn-ribbon protein